MRPTGGGEYAPTASYRTRPRATSDRKGCQLGDEARTVLVVEDEADLASLVEVNLQLAGYDVQLAEDGERALEVIGERQPDLVLLDVMMPGIDGWTVLRQIKEEEVTQDLPVVMLTALTEERDLIRGHLQGAIEYVTKPFEMRRLLSAVETALRPATDDERAERRRRTMMMLQRLAELETGRSAQTPPVHLSRLERTPSADQPSSDTATRVFSPSQTTSVDSRPHAAILLAGSQAMSSAGIRRISSLSLTRAARRPSRSTRYQGSASGTSSLPGFSFQRK